MGDSPLQEVSALAAAYAMLAAVTLPAAFVLRAIAKIPPVNHLLRPTTLEVLALLFFALILPSNLMATCEQLRIFEMLQLAAEPERTVFASIIGCILWLAIYAIWRGRREPALIASPAACWQRDLAAGIFGFLAFTPVTFAVYFAATAILQAFGGQPEQHLLTKIDLSTPAGVALFIAGSCLCGPILEEITFRGLLLPWSLKRRLRPWIIFAFGMLFLFERPGVDSWSKILFAIDLVMLMAFAFFGRQVWKMWPSRTASAIASTSVLFGALHAAVWPTPVPLTVLGLGLGILAVRRGSVRPAIIAHALFNGVSVIVLLRRGS